MHYEYHIFDLLMFESCFIILLLYLQDNNKEKKNAKFYKCLVFIMIILLRTYLFINVYDM